MRESFISRRPWLALALLSLAIACAEANEEVGSSTGALVEEAPPLTADERAGAAAANRASSAKARLAARQELANEIVGAREERAARSDPSAGSTVPADRTNELEDRYWRIREEIVEGHMPDGDRAVLTAEAVAAAERAGNTESDTELDELLLDEYERRGR